MSDTRQVLARISAFRARLESVPRLAPMDGALAKPTNRLAPVFAEAIVSEPAQLTGRAYRLLSDAKQLVDQQKRLTVDSLLALDHDPLSKYHRGTIGLTDSALRLAQIFPAAAESQLRMCDGFEHLLQVVRHRLGVLEQALAFKRADVGRVDRMVGLLTAMQAGKAVSSGAFLELAEVLLDDARQGNRMRFLSCDPAIDGVARFVAMHAINVGQVLARIVSHDYEWAMKPTLPIVAALVMDAGLLSVPADLLTKSEPLTAEELRVVERHPLLSAEWIRAAMPDTGPLADLIALHHERLDGSGYSKGLKADEIPTLPRLLAVADCYAARMADRPHAPACDPRAALTETLLEAEAGKLDRDCAEYLLHLSFHPIGTVVELTDGRIAVVAATHNSRTNFRASMRPVVAVLTDSRGAMLPRPEFVDLATTEVGSIVRAVPLGERREKLGEWYPDLCL